MSHPHAHAVSRTWHLHQKTSSGQRGPASSAKKGIRRAAAFVPFCSCLSSPPVGRLVTLSASPCLDTLATQPPGYGRSPTHFAPSLHAFTSLACSASALAPDVATTAHTQCATTYCFSHRDYHLWTLTRVCPDPGFASRLSRLRTLDVDSPVERVRLPIFSPLFPMKHAFCLTRSIFFLFSLLLPSPSFILTTGQRNVFLAFLFVCYYLREN
jgi:hypothetical protein